MSAATGDDFEGSQVRYNLRRESDGRPQIAPRDLARILEFPPLKFYSVGSIVLGPSKDLHELFSNCWKKKTLKTF